MLPAIVVLFVSAWCSGAIAADNADSLASVVGSDAALFVEVRDLDRQWTALSQSKLGRRCQESDLSRLFWAIRIDPIQKSQALELQVAKVTGVPFSEQVRALFGEAVALALYLPPEGDPQGVLIARATSPEAVERVLKSWDQLEPPLRTERRSSELGQYYRRVMRRGREERSLYYVKHDQFFALSDHEPLVRDCLDRWLASTKPSPGASAKSERPAALSASAEFQDVAVRWPDDALAVMYLPPRRWDAVLQKEPPKDPPAELLLEVWKSLRAVGAAVRTRSGLQLELSLLLEPDRVSSEWRDFAANPAAPTIIESAPSDAVAVVAARFPPWMILERWHGVLSERERRELDKGLSGIRGLLLDRDVLADVLPKLFADWGVVVQARANVPEEAPWWTAWSATAIGFVPRESAPPLREAVDNALLFGMNLLALDRNTRTESAGWSVLTTKTGDRLRRSLRGPLPLQPGYDWLPDRWLLGSHEAGLDTLAAAEATRSASPTPLRLAAARQFPHAQFVAWSDLARLRTSPGYQRLARQGEGDQPPLPLVLLRHIPGIADEAFLAGSWTETGITLSLGLTERE